MSSFSFSWKYFLSWNLFFDLFLVSTVFFNFSSYLLLVPLRSQIRSTLLPALFNVSFVISMLHPGAVVSNLESLALVILFSCTDNCSNWCFHKGTSSGDLFYLDHPGTLHSEKQRMRLFISLLKISNILKFNILNIFNYKTNVTF